MSSRLSSVNMLSSSKMAAVAEHEDQVLVQVQEDLESGTGTEIESLVTASASPNVE